MIERAPIRLRRQTFLRNLGIGQMYNNNEHLNCNILFLRLPETVLTLPRESYFGFFLSQWYFLVLLSELWQIGDIIIDLPYRKQLVFIYGCDKKASSETAERYIITKQQHKRM